MGTVFSVLRSPCRCNGYFTLTHGNGILTSQLSLALQRLLHSNSWEPYSRYSALSGTTTGTSFSLTKTVHTLHERQRSGVTQLPLWMQLTQKDSSCLLKALATGSYTHLKVLIALPVPRNLNQTTPTHCWPFKWVAHRSGATHSGSVVFWVIHETRTETVNLTRRKAFDRFVKVGNPIWVSQDCMRMWKMRNYLEELVTLYCTHSESTIFHVYNK